MKKEYSAPTIDFLDYYVSEKICCTTSTQNDDCTPGCPPLNHYHDDWDKWIDFWKIWNKRRRWHW